VRQLILRLTFIFVSFAGTAFSIAQENGSGGSEDDVEGLYDQMDQQTDQSAEKKAIESSNKAQTDQNSRVLPEARTISDLNQLQPFSDIAVIERRFLPKTGRLEISGMGLTSVNNPFFSNIGASGKLAYYLSEQFAVEGMATGLSVAQRQTVSDLKTTGPYYITTSNVVTAKSYYGAAVKWNPVYGKISFLNRAIVPFDINFSLGGGVTNTDQNRAEPTVHLGTSQIFAVSKSFGVRWDLDWNFYNAHSTNNRITSVSLHNDLFLGLGVSVYIPEATYR
jgi:outer membrane beta-barrel protein